MEKKWLLYGAYGYTGELIAEEAIARGHRPVLAGRSQKKLAPLAAKLGLDMRVFDLRNEMEVAEHIAEFDLVFHAAGPFIHTSLPMVRACLRTQTHYVDITGEVPVFEQNFGFDAEAQAASIAIVYGAGFDVVPSDCLAAYVAQKINNPVRLDIAFATPGGRPSAGTTKSALENLSIGVRARHNGELVHVNPKKTTRKVRFSDCERHVMQISWGDLATAYRTTGIGNIRTFMAVPPQMASRAGGYLRTGRKLLKFGALRWLAKKWVEKSVKGPDAETRATARSYFWARVENDAGRFAEAWLETPEGYYLTALAGVRIVEKLLAGSIAGACTPAVAFGDDFVLELPNVLRFDQLQKNP